MIDNVGGETGIKSLNVIKDSGVVVTVPTITADKVLKAAQKINMPAKKFVVEFKKDQLKKIIELVNQKKIKVHINAVFELKDAKKAHDKIQEKHTQGKIILKIN